MGLVKVQSARAVPESHVVGEHASAAVIEALNCLRVAITIYDSNQILIYANQHFDYLFRSLPQRNSLIGMPYDALVRLEVESGEIADEAHGGDVEGFLARRRAQFNEGDFHPLDVPLSDGRIIELKARRTPEGGWIALWTDATQARHATSRLEKAIELSADAFAFFDRNDKLVVCNQEFAAIYGRSLPEMRGTEFRTMIADAVARERILIEGDKDVWLQRRLDLHNSPAGAMTLETKLGKAYLVRDRKTKGGGRVTVLTDVTDERRVEIALGQTRQALAESQGEAQKQASYLADLTRRLDAVRSEADNAKKTLLRTMSHELKTPLNAIIGFSDLLMQMAQGLGPDQIREYAGLIHAGGHNLLRLINQILDLTKVAGGKFELHRTRLDAGGALWLASDAFGERAAARDIRIDASACPIGLLVDVDESAFGQMVHQLLDNALSFTQDGGVIAPFGRAQERPRDAERRRQWAGRCVGGPGADPAAIRTGGPQCERSQGRRGPWPHPRESVRRIACRFALHRKPGRLQDSPPRSNCPRRSSSAACLRCRTHSRKFISNFRKSYFETAPIRKPLVFRDVGHAQF